MKNQNFFNIKSYHIILFSFILTHFLVQGLYNLRPKKLSIKEESPPIFLRRLDFQNDTDAICEKGSKKLRDYYETRDPTTMGLKAEIGETDKPGYIDSLIDIIDKGSLEGEGAEENAKEYAKHLAPAIFCLAVTILAIPGWICCCSCSCCGCCCCCCLKKLCCNTPLYIVLNVLYAAIVAISIYGLSQSKAIFVGLADTECALLKFVGEILDGEIKETKPKWGGIANIQNLFSNTLGQINSLQRGTLNKLNDSSEKIKQKKENFENNLRDDSRSINSEFSTSCSPPSTSPPTTCPNSYETSDGYFLDLANDFGKYPDDIGKLNKLVGLWYSEYSQTSQLSDNYLILLSN